MSLRAQGLINRQRRPLTYTLTLFYITYMYTQSIFVVHFQTEINIQYSNQKLTLILTSFINASNCKTPYNHSVSADI